MIILNTLDVIKEDAQHDRKEYNKEKLRRVCEKLAERKTVKTENDNFWQ